MPVSVVTGATGGIGRWIALGLARAGHVVVAVGRDRQRGDVALAWIAEQAPAAQLEMVVADLSSLAAAREAGQSIAARHPAIDVLVNNAGVFCGRREQTPEGHERVIAVNHLAPFVLTRTLVPALQSAAGARIVNVGSDTSDRARIDPANLELTRGWGMVRSYSQSKLAIMIATFGWARRLHGTGVTANVVHPGLVATGLVRTPGLVGLGWRALAPFSLTEEQGADTPVHVATAPGFREITGAYVKKRQVVRPNRRALDLALAERVWLATEALAGG
jgi:NAD(P)-dependent dehydrogenase (short-subunit alcohol dehydrogenase family)